MIVLRFVQMTKANIHQFQKSMKVEDVSSVPRSEEIFGERDRRGGTPEESSEITKAGVIDGRFSIDLPALLFPKRTCHRCIGVGQFVFRTDFFFF